MHVFAGSVSSPPEHQQPPGVSIGRSANPAARSRRLIRNALIDSRSIIVTAAGGRVILTGTVRFWADLGRQTTHAR
jgi:hypothetical protein